VQPGWQVLVYATPLARPLVDEVMRGLAEHDAYARIELDGVVVQQDGRWLL
jgi:hypothetical protein